MKPEETPFEPEEATPITLTRAEALVLFDWLHRLESDAATPGDQAERIALWNLSAVFERTLVEPFSPDYAALLTAAKAHLISADAKTDQLRGGAEGADSK